MPHRLTLQQLTPVSSGCALLALARRVWWHAKCCMSEAYPSTALRQARRYQVLPAALVYTIAHSAYGSLAQRIAMTDQALHICL